jgi:diadenosine tetraphosphate (Ap4A) HIT family hydrolase
MHCHIHLIPRREGDVENPQGGVRSVIPKKQHYKRKNKILLLKTIYPIVLVDILII